MRKLIKTLKASVLLAVSVFLLASCGGGETKEESLKDDQLSAFMLGGMYFYNGFGGIDAVETMISSAGYSSDKQIISGYKELFEFPFTTEQKSSIKSMFSSMWDINSKDDLLATLKDFKRKESKYKAWDYARIINNSCMGYAADYLSKAEVLDIIKEVLPLAKSKYKDWKAYFNDFDLGRKEWNSEDPQAESFETITKNVAKNPKSIYNLLPLN